MRVSCLHLHYVYVQCPKATHQGSCIHSGAAQNHLYSRIRTSHHAVRNTTVHRDCHAHSDLQAEDGKRYHGKESLQ